MLLQVTDVWNVDYQYFEVRDKKTLNYIIILLSGKQYFPTGDYLILVPIFCQIIQRFCLSES